MRTSEPRIDWTLRLEQLPIDEQHDEMEKLFMRLMHNYGTLWSARFPKEAVLQSTRNEWRIALRTITRRKIRKAVAKCYTEHKKYPPTLGEFLQLCKEREGPWLGSTMPPKYQRPALPNPERFGRFEAMRRMRETLGLPHPLPRPDPYEPHYEPA